jgi:hypothetical protein
MTSLFGRMAVLAAITFATTVANAQESTNRVAMMTDWNVFVEEEPKMCWGVSKPKESVNSRDGQPVSVRRGDILLFVTFNPGLPPQISFTGGYPFAAGSLVEMAIDGEVYSMIPGVDGTETEWAWPGTPEDDAALLAALKGGTTAVMTARSGKGTQTVDTFSLRGFTAAMEDAGTRCQ